MTNNYQEKLISIITVTKNAELTLEECIKSVLFQSYKNIEHIIIDGNSTDGTHKIIKKYRGKINKLVVEDDEGIWDAMNKGIKIANGDIIGFLNSDDFYYKHTLKVVNNYFCNNNIDFLFGSVEKYKLLHGFTPWKIHFSFGFYTSHSVGFFIDTNKHKAVGLYNKKYKSADLDFFYKMINNFKLKGTASKKNEIFGKFRKGGYSSKINYIDHLLDLNKIRIDNNQNFIFVYLLFFIKIIKRPLKFLKGLINKLH